MSLRKVVPVGIAAVVFSIVAALPAQAMISNNGRSCVAIGSFGEWRAQKFYDNDWVGNGPKRWTKTGANSDCRQFVFGF